MTGQPQRDAERQADRAAEEEAQAAYDQSVVRLERWVLHSPSTGRTWRGIKKCQRRSVGGVLLFETEAEAEVFRSSVLTKAEQRYWFRVRIVLEVPAVGQPLTTVEP